jgi:GTPase
VWEWEAEVLIITHSTTITRNYEAVVHCGATRQTAKIVWMREEVLRSGHR